MIEAWHFVSDKLRDGRDIPADGELLRHDGELFMGQSGLHASRRIIDALKYAPGSTICRVACAGKVIEHADKLVCTERTIIWRINGESILREFARECALGVMHLWDAPDIVRRYLQTGDESLRVAARDAAGVAAAASDAARLAASDAASDAARVAASDAAWGAARFAAWGVASDASLERDAVWAAARTDAIAAQNERLEPMVNDERKKR